MSSLSGRPSQSQCLVIQAPAQITTASALIVPSDGAHAGDATVLHVIAFDRDAGKGADTPLVALLLERANRSVGAGIARWDLMQHHVGLLDIEVGPDFLEKALGFLADIHVGLVAGGVLALVHLLVIGLLVAFADRHIAHLLEAEIDRVGLPHIDRVPQDVVDGRRHIEIAHAAAGDAGGAGPRAVLVDEHDVRALALARALELHREVPGSRHAVHAHADNDIGSRFR